MAGTGKKIVRWIQQAYQRGLARVRRGKPRPAFRFKTDQADIFIIRFSGQRRVIRCKHVGSLTSQKTQKDIARKNFLELKLFNLLFPENSITPVAVSSINIRGRKRWGVVSEILRKKSSDYKKFQKRNYGKPKKNKYDLETFRHDEFLSGDSVVNMRRKIAEAGIHVNTHGVNTANVDGKPIFFEIDRMDFLWMKERLKNDAIPKEKRGEYQSLLEEYYKIPEQQAYTDYT